MDFFIVIGLVICMVLLQWWSLFRFFDQKDNPQDYDHADR